MESPLTALLKLWDGLRARAEEDAELRELLRRGAAGLAELAAALGEPRPEGALEAGAPPNASDQSRPQDVWGSRPDDGNERYNEAYSEDYGEDEDYDEAYDDEAYDDEAYDDEDLGFHDGDRREPRAPARPYHTERAAEEVAAALRLKGRAARWLASHGYTRDPAALDARGALIGEGKAANVYLWTLMPTLVDPQDAPAHRALAEAFANASASLDLFEAAAGGRERRAAGALLAEAQSALQRAVSRAYRGDKPRFFDPDQHAAYRLVRDYAAAEGAALPFMSLGDAADPENHEDLRERLEAFGERLGKSGRSRSAGASS